MKGEPQGALPSESEAKEPSSVDWSLMDAMTGVVDDARCATIGLGSARGPSQR